MSTLITSPVGEVLKMFLNRKVLPFGSKDETQKRYEILLRFDAATDAGKAFKKQIEAINANIVGTKHVNKATEYTIRATTYFDPKVLDAAGNQLAQNEIPSFPQGSSGKASMVLKEKSGPRGKGLSLVAVGLAELDLAEVQQSENKDTSHLDALRDAIKSA